MMFAIMDYCLYVSPDACFWHLEAGKKSMDIFS